MKAINHFNHTDMSLMDVKRHHNNIKSIQRTKNRTTTEVRTKTVKTLAPSEDDMEITTPYLDIHTLRAISKRYDTQIYGANHN